MKAYIENAVVDNLAGYLGKDMGDEEARTLTYSVLFKAVCPSNLSRVPVLRRDHADAADFLDTMGVNSAMAVDRRSLQRVSEVFEQARIIVRIPNIDAKSTLKEQYYITNPSLACQLIKAAYGLDSVGDAVLGHVFESCAMVQLAANRLAEHEIYFADSGGRTGVPNKELDIIITDREREHAYFFECKHTQNDQIKSGAAILSGEIEKKYFQGADIDGRYVIYNGNPCVKEYGVGDIMFTPLSPAINNYFAFSENTEGLERRPIWHGPGHDDAAHGAGAPEAQAVQEAQEEKRAAAGWLRSLISRMLRAAAGIIGIDGNPHGTGQAPKAAGMDAIGGGTGPQSPENGGMPHNKDVVRGALPGMPGGNRPGPGMDGGAPPPGLPSPNSIEDSMNYHA